MTALLLPNSAASTTKARAVTCALISNVIVQGQQTLLDGIDHGMHELVADGDVVTCTLISTVNAQLATLLMLQRPHIDNYCLRYCAWPRAHAVRAAAALTRHSRVTMRNNKSAHPRIVPLSWRADDPE